MKSFPLRIYTTERSVFEGECESLVVPTAQGLYGILANHSDLIATVCAGELQYKTPGAESFECYAVTPGILTVRKGETTVLVEAAEKASEIDFPRAMAQFQHAKEMMETEDKLSKKMAELKLMRAVNRLKVSSSHNVGV